MKCENTYKWTPEPGNVIQQEFAEFLKVYEKGVTRNQWVCLYAAFLAGIIAGFTNDKILKSAQQVTELSEEGRLVSRMMNEENQQNQNN